ncbi:hypothetical protein TNCT6_18310 [Streptomyces sp. 6-11-2]|nr:hypothetical protein TNCT6_18310 [Streptomyces sp. 6-11-2]
MCRITINVAERNRVLAHHGVLARSVPPARSVETAVAGLGSGSSIATVGSWQRLGRGTGRRTGARLDGAGHTVTISEKGFVAGSGSYGELHIHIEGPDEPPGGVPAALPSRS